MPADDYAVYPSRRNRRGQSLISNHLGNSQPIQLRNRKQRFHVSMGDSGKQLSFPGASLSVFDIL
jgi:hypothetical protein